MTVVGLVGAGNWGGNWLRTLASMPEAELRWCCDLNTNLLEQISKQHPKMRTTTRFDDLIADDQLDGIVIAAIARTHYPL